MRVSLTDLTVKNLAAPERGQRMYLDQAVPGFGVRVSQGGTKTFTLMYGPARRLLTIGRYPVISLAQARQKARAILAEKTLGIHQEMPRVGFEEGYALFLNAYRLKNRDKTVYEMQRLVRRHLMPKFRRCTLVEIGTQEVAVIIERIVDTPAECRALFVAARTLFRWLERRKLIKASPLAGFAAPTRLVSRERALTDDELRTVFLAAQDGSTFGKIVQLLILTGQRKAQIGNLRAECIDWRGNLIVWSSSAMKGNRRHSLPLTTMVAAVLADEPREGFVFAGRRKDSAFNGFSKSKAALDRTLPNLEPWTLHDLRRTFSTGLAQLRVPPHIKEMLLAHSLAKDPIEAIYDRHTYEDEMREALEKWERHLTAILDRE